MEKDYYISDEEIARRLGIDRHSVTRMIKRYRKELEEFGVIRVVRVQGERGASTKYRLLTEPEQYILLMSFVGNTEKSLKLKVEIVREIFTKKNEEAHI